MNRNKLKNFKYDMTLVFVCSSKINVLIHTKIFIQKILLSDVLSENRYVAVIEKVFAWLNMSPWCHCFLRSPEFTLYDQTGWPRSQAGVFLWSHYDSIHQPEIVRSSFQFKEISFSTFSIRLKHLWQLKFWKWSPVFLTV